MILLPTHCAALHEEPTCAVPMSARPWSKVTSKLKDEPFKAHGWSPPVAEQRSEDKVCGVCLKVVLDKDPGKRQFGILPNCSHCVCLECIRTCRNPPPPPPPPLESVSETSRVAPSVGRCRLFTPQAGDGSEATKSSN